MDGFAIDLLGGLRIIGSGQGVAADRARLSKPLELLALLLQAPGSELSNDQLVERLWEEDEVENPGAVLKNAAYSLRKLLQEEFPGTDCVVTVARQYRWNPKAPVTVDVWAFERLANQLENTAAPLPAADWLCLARRAVQLYKGDFLPELAGRQWVLVQAAYLRRRYLKIVCELCARLMNTGEHADREEVLALCNRAVALEPLSEELYLWQFAAMRALGMKSAVLNYYPVAATLFFDQLGAALPEQVREIYLWAAEGNDHQLEDIHQILGDLDEATRDTRPIRGAYFCPYEVFKHMYHMVVRSASRADNCVVLILLTLDIASGCTVPRERLAQTMAALREIVQDTLRKGDVFSRYSASQYILMLSMNETQDSELVEARLRAAFAAHHPPLAVQLAFVAAEPENLL